MPMTVSAGLFAIVFYLMGALFQGQSVFGGHTRRREVLVLGFLAVAAHAISAFGVIRKGSGYHFGIVEISTLITFSICLLVLISSLRKPLANLLLGLFPLAILTILASLTVTSRFPPTQMDSGLAGHVLLSIIAYSLMTIAALQAGFLAFQNYQLKHHHAGGLIRKFPPLQDMETLLFELLWVGEIVLTLGIAAGFLFVEDLLQQDGLLHKTFFSLLAWVVFAVLLWGRHQQGWRGRTAIRFTLTGFVFLLLGFYGSKFALEYVFA